MKYVDEYRDPVAVRRVVARIAARATRNWTLMEVCGGQTHAILEHGLDALLGDSVTLLHGPGCPVCVTPVETLDAAWMLAARPEVTLCSFGDMLRVPGSHGDLQAARARGGDVRVVYSPLDAVRIAAREPAREVVFLAVGFETTAPSVAAAARWSRRRGLRNFSLLVSHVRVPPAIEAILADPRCRVQAFLAAGHVCTVMGTREYEPIAARHRVPIIATGFEPLDIAEGVALAVEQLEAGVARVEIQYQRVVQPEGNAVARALLDEVFEPVDRAWRGIGVLPNSGLGLRSEWSELDATHRFGLATPELSRLAAHSDASCRAGEVLRGLLKPDQCGEFGRTCTPERPRGAPMVSSEGACAAYFRYRAHDAAEAEAREAT